MTHKEIQNGGDVDPTSQSEFEIASTMGKHEVKMSADGKIHINVSGFKATFVSLTDFWRRKADLHFIDQRL